ncbi:MAG: ATP-binding cassette domain-containing protein, partial [Candidatus Rokuibacteriota bacterium]
MIRPPVVELDGVRVAYGGATVLDVPALAIGEGEILTVIGPNGSGKSTLLRVAGLLERPTRGVVRFRGRPTDAAHSLPERRRMATVFQHPLLADMTVAQNVALGLGFRDAADEGG